MKSTPLSRANPLALLTIGLFAIVGSLGVRDLRVGLVTVAVVVALGAVLVPRGSHGAWRLLGPMLGAASVALSTWLLAGRDGELAVTAGLRILVLAVPGVWIAPLIDPQRLGDYLAQRLRLPARPVAAVTVSLQRFEALGATWTQLEWARRSRGLGPGADPVARLRHVSALTFGLLVGALRGSARTAVAMDARGFASARWRTWAEPAPWRGVDTAVVLGAVALAALPYALSYALAAWL